VKKKYRRNFDQLEQMVTDTEQFFADENIDVSLRMKVDLSLEELFVNMVTYNTESEEEILVEMRPIEDGVEVSLTDYDVERFDPTIVRGVDVDAPLAERSPGGLGLYLVLKMADTIHYEYHDRTSKITFTNRLAAGEAGQDV
jgi:anti-sigma regulatory factor (Ser/Thr protein kinase)